MNNYKKCKTNKCSGFLSPSVELITSGYCWIHDAKNKNKKIKIIKLN